MSTYIIATAAPVAAATPAAAPAEAAIQTTTQSTEQPSTCEAAPAAEGGSTSMIFSFLLIGVIFYFLMIRPQMKQQKAQKARQEGMKVGDKIITNAGIHGIIREVLEQAVRVEVAPNVLIKIEKSCVTSTLDKAGNSTATDKK